MRYRYHSIAIVTFDPRAEHIQGICSTDLRYKEVHRQLWENSLPQEHL